MPRPRAPSAPRAAARSRRRTWCSQPWPTASRGSHSSMPASGRRRRTAPGSSSRSSGKGARPMKIGMCMFLWTTHVTDRHVALLKDIKATGFDGVEIPIFEGSPDHYARLGETLDGIGLQRTAVSAMGDPAMNLISPDAATRKAGIAYMKWAIDCAAALGADRLSGPLHSTLGAFTGKGPTAAEKK